MAILGIGGSGSKNTVSSEMGMNGAGVVVGVDEADGRINSDDLQRPTLEPANGGGGGIDLLSLSVISTLLGSSSVSEDDDDDVLCLSKLRDACSVDAAPTVDVEDKAADDEALEELCKCLMRVLRFMSLVESFEASAS